MNNGFSDDPIESPGDRQQGKAILHVVKPGGPVGTQSMFLEGIGDDAI